MAEPSSSPHLFADVLARVHASAPRSRPRPTGPRASISRAWWSSRRAMPPMATWRPMPRWCLPRRPRQSRAISPRRSPERLRADALIATVDVAGPGFINLTLKPQAWADALRTVLREGAAYGRSAIGGGEKVNVEYVSANPTGPMHVGHCRGAVFGDALCSLLQFAGYRRHARILHQRRRRAGRRARALGVPALSRGARRGHRRDSGRALSRRLSEAGRGGACRRSMATSC